MSFILNFDIDKRRLLVCFFYKIRDYSNYFLTCFFIFFILSTKKLIN